MPNQKTDQKIDDKLRKELERLEKSGETAQRLSVIIEVAATARVPGDQDVGGLEDQVRASQQPLLARLAALGAREVQPMVLANAVAAELTPAQVREIAGDASVKRIIWNVAERVTL